MKVQLTRDIVKAGEGAAGGSAAEGATWTLSPLDRVNHWLVLRGTWVFDADLDADALKHGLSALLGHYPHLSGRMREGRAVALNDAGIPFTTAERRDLSVADFEARPSLAGEMSNPLDRGRVKRGREAPLTARLTRLADGSVLGLRCSHACADGETFYTMVLNWARLVSGRPVVKPCLDPGLLMAPKTRTKDEVLRDARAAGWMRPSPASLLFTIPSLLFGRLNERTPPLHVPGDLLLRIREQARESAASPTLGTQEALAAHLACAAPRLFGLDEGTPCEQVLVADLRERLARVPRNFVGNASFVFPGARFAAGASFAEVASRAHEALASYLARPSPAVDALLGLALEVMHHDLFLMPYDATAMHRSKSTLSYINSFARLPVYEVDFGAPGRPILPVRVIPHDLPDPFLVWPAPPAWGGVELYLTGVAARAAAHRDARRIFLPD